ncbi:hypothetical protein ES695_04225 [Candidatus Atribacteria bacterium 1244-E10-H5-B2]|nr:MAG: hypothetical protein ES695_04225 [Candidatus Atribacteria bacterium 1244-E10-H5-B2]
MFSINAMGTIDKKLIYRKRKGIDDIKKYTKTVNPNLPGQQTQKGYFKEAILAWGSEGYSARDIQAWNLLARTKKVIVSGFNRFASYRINAGKEGLTWSRLTNCIIYDVIAGGFKVDVNVESDLSGVLYIGTSKYSMLSEITGIFSVDKYTFTITGLSKDTKYYFYIANSSVGEAARTGIYSHYNVFKGLPPVTIDIGGEAIERSSEAAVTNTKIDKNNPANATGIITSVEIWAWTSLDDFEVAIFYMTDTNVFSTRSNHFIGAVTGGSKQTFKVNLAVQEGDYIGYYGSVGTIGRDKAGGLGYWYFTGDSIPCTDVEFTLSGNTTFIYSVYGTKQ